MPQTEGPQKFSWREEDFRTCDSSCQEVEVLKRTVKEHQKLSLPTRMCLELGEVGSGK